jgi:glucose-6-phosphate 1-dehydrogenase
MANDEADAFVFFGATGDLASRQIFPALQALIQARPTRDADHWGREIGDRY